VNLKIRRTKALYVLYNSIKTKAASFIRLNRKTTEELAKMLMANGIKAVAYHAGLDAKLRSERQDQFLNEDIHVIVATIAFGMGIDKPMYGLLYITIFQNQLKIITRKPEGPEEMAWKENVSCIIHTRMWPNWNT
jgi:superfamily II DNA or RNA helicase